MEVAESLTREFSIFTGANALVFALLGVTVAIRKQARLQLALPALVLLDAAGLVGYLYIFNQNWLHSVVFGEYVGLAYFGYLAVAATFLADIAFNKARVTTELLNAAFHAVSSAIQVVPC
jgi:1,4-dihydroxy-2-naphthoate octaprenyltransferase